MYHKLDFWFLNVPDNRVGGPWWTREFVYEHDLYDFLRTLEPFLKEYKIYKFSMENGHYGIEFMCHKRRIGADKCSEKFSFENVKLIEKWD